MSHRSWAVAERLSLPVIYAELKARGARPIPGVTEERIDYGSDPNQHVVQMTPHARRPGDPLVYFIHGGSWRHGSPEQFRAVGNFFARHGYIAALGGYRLVLGTRFPGQLHDALDGLRAALERRVSAGHQDGPVIISGQSAGGHLAALAAFDEETRRERGLGDAPITGVLPVSGVLDFDALCSGGHVCPLVSDLMGTEEGWGRADPARFVHGGPRIPVLCLHGSRDPLVPVEVAASFVLRANGAEGDHAAFVADPRGHHADLTRIFYRDTPLTRSLLEWLDDVSSV